MSFTTPLGLLALLALPAVVALHLFRNRLPDRRVAALFLFAEQSLIAGAGRTRTRLLRTASLWLELLAALLLALWLGGLSFGGTAAQHVVVVLDDSASMQAGGHARAQQELRTRLGRLGSGDFVSVLRTGERPEVLAGPRARAADAEAALARCAASTRWARPSTSRANWRSAAARCGSSATKSRRPAATTSPGSASAIRRRTRRS
jgi:hypothetical protein